MTHAQQELGLLPSLLLPAPKYFKSFSQEQTHRMKECHASLMNWRPSSTQENHSSLGALRVQFQT